MSNTLSQARRPRTAKAYQTQFELYMAFVCMLGLSDLNDLHTVLAFMQFLADNNLSVNTIANYVSATKQMLLFYNLDASAFDNIRVSLFIKSLTINRPLVVKTQGIIDIHTLRAISQACVILQHPLMFRSIFLLAFFSFLRISNFAPARLLDFDVTRHLARGDLIWAPPGAHIIIKWAKNLQTRDSINVIQIPRLGDKTICPVFSLQQYFFIISSRG